LDRKVLENNFSHTLADHYKTAWVPEFARDYLRNGIKVSLFVMLMICYPLLMAKLNLKITACPSLKVFVRHKLISNQGFSEVYYNYCDPLLDKAAQEHEYDLFFLTDIDVPWEKTI
jgi:nicotinamide riboside kinase